MVGRPKVIKTDSRSTICIIHPLSLLRELLKSTLEQIMPARVIGFDFNQARSADFKAHLKCDVLLIDATIGKTFLTHLVRRMKRAVPDARVLAIVPATDKDLAVSCIAAGAHGCITGDASIDDLQEALAEIRDQGVTASNELLVKVFARFVEISQEAGDRQAADIVLSDRELEVLKLVAAHMGNKQIAKRLGISIYTVKNHIHKILEKLKLGTRFEAVTYSRRQGWLENNELPS